MYKKLRINFLKIAIFSVFVVLLLIIGIINFVYYYQLNSRADDVLEYLALNGGYFPDSSTMYGNSNLPFSVETPYRTRYFTVTVDNNTVLINTGHIASVLPSEAYVYAQEVIDEGKEEGLYKNFKYLVVHHIDGYQIIFLDFNTELDSLKNVMLLSIFLLAVILVVVSALILFLSKPILKPIVENIQKQRQFITDASHEIKTPLAIISADADVIELENGKSEWTKSIKDQIKRLSELIANMLTLSKMEGDIPDGVITEFDLSSKVKEIAEKFSPVAINEKKNYQIDIEPNLKFKGNKDGIDQLSSVLLNNAFKYTNDQGDIILKVRKKSRGVEIEVYNTTDQLPEGDLNKLFDRFYKADKSRSNNKGSYGIGLSIAKAVANQHKGEMEVEKMGKDGIVFRATLNSL